MESIIGDESEQLTFFLTEFKSCIIEKLPTCLIDHKAEFAHLEKHSNHN